MIKYIILISPIILFSCKMCTTKEISYQKKETITVKVPQKLRLEGEILEVETTMENNGINNDGNNPAYLVATVQLRNNNLDYGGDFQIYLKYKKNSIYDNDFITMNKSIFIEGGETKLLSIYREIENNEIMTNGLVNLLTNIITDGDSKVDVSKYISLYDYSIYGDVIDVLVEEQKDTTYTFTELCNTCDRNCKKYNDELSSLYNNVEIKTVEN